MVVGEGPGMSLPAEIRNPTTNSINFNNLVIGSSIVVRNMLGEEIINIKATHANLIIDLCAYESGMYFIQVSDDTHVQAGSFQKL